MLILTRGVGQATLIGNEIKLVVQQITPARMAELVLQAPAETRYLAPDRGEQVVGSALRVVLIVTADQTVVVWQGAELVTITVCRITYQHGHEHLYGARLKLGFEGPQNVLIVREELLRSTHEAKACTSLLPPF